MKKIYVKELNMNIYKKEDLDSFYGVSDYLDVSFLNKGNRVFAVEGTTCKYGSFEDLRKEDLKSITDIVQLYFN